MREYNAISMINITKWTSPDEDISSLELLTIVVALKLWTGLRISVRYDNEAAVTVAKTGWCCNPFMNSCLCEICYFAVLYQFEDCAVHVPGVSFIPMGFLLPINKGTILSA